MWSISCRTKMLRVELKVFRRLTKDMVWSRHTCAKLLHRLAPASILKSDHQCVTSHWNSPQHASSSTCRNLQFEQQRQYNYFCNRNTRQTNCSMQYPEIVLRKVPYRCANFSARKLVEASPPKIQPYMRLLRVDRPIGTYLLFWPCTWSIGLAAQAGCFPDPYILALFGVGSFVMRGAGCIINDMWDKDIDKMVERTKTRPLASGELTPFQALVFLGGNLSIALTILLQLNWFSVYLGAASMLLVIAYPLAKRYTYWPQVVLGITLNWGVLLAWSALRGSLEWPVLPLYTAWLTFNYGAMLGWCAVKGNLGWPIIPLYVGCLLWTLVYDTIYAHQDKYDDLLIGVKSTALKLGDQTKPWLAGFSGMMIGCLVLTGHLCDQTWPYYAAVAATGSHLVHQLYTVDLNNPDDCLKKFKSNTQLGAIMFLGIVLGTLFKSEDDEENKEKN